MKDGVRSLNPFELGRDALRSELGGDKPSAAARLLGVLPQKHNLRVGFASLSVSRPGKPARYALIGPLNSKPRGECLALRHVAPAASGLRLVHKKMTTP